MLKIEIKDYIKPKYKFEEIIRFQKLPLDVKELITVEVLRQAFAVSRHKIAVAFSGGKDSQVVSDIIERNFPEKFKEIYCIFGNTGIEFPESLKFAREYGRLHYGERFRETELLKLKEDELRYDFARQIVAEVESENALDEILKPDGKLKGQKALTEAAKKRGYKLTPKNCFFKGHTMNFSYCIEQFGAPLLGKASSKLDAHRINIECFLKYSESNTKKDELKEYYDVLRECKFSQHCCKLLKKEPSERIQSRLDVDMLIKGLMASESHSRMTSISTRGHIFASSRPHIKDGPFYHVSPIALWTDNDIWEYIRKYDLEYSPLYDITYTASDGSKQHIKRNGCIMCGTDIQFSDNHLSILRQTHPKAWSACMNNFGYSEELYKLFRAKKSGNILDSFTDEGTKARLIERFGDTKRLLEIRPCAYDDFGELVELNGTGFDTEYDAEIFIQDDGQVVLF